MKAALTRLIPVALCACAVFSVAGCGGGREIPERLESGFAIDRPDVLRLGLYGDALSLSPIGHHAEYERLICNLVHAAPLRRAPDASLQPDLFESWVSYPDEAGRLVVDAFWKTGLRWHDGVPFDTKALAFTFEMMKQPGNGSPYAALASQVVRIDELDRGKRVRIVFATSSRRSLELLTAGLLPPHLLEGKQVPEALVPRIASDPEAGVSTPTASASLAAYTEFPVGMGPYRLVNRRRGRFIELEAWPQTASQTLAFSRILVRCHPQLESLLADFRNGRLDWMPVPSEIASKIEELKIPQVRFLRYPNPSFLFWGFNTRRPPFDRPALRMALDEGLDRASLRLKIPYDGELLGLASDAADTAGGRRDLAAALEAAGFRDTNGDGRREADGKPLELKILVNEENLSRKLVAEEIVRQLNLVGISGTVEGANWSELLGKRLASDSWDSFLLAFQQPTDGNVIDLWHTPASAAGALNTCGVSDPELDAALDRLDTWPEVASAAELRATVQARIAAVRPGAFLFRPFDVAMCREGLIGPASETGIIDMQPATWNKLASQTP
ncbi:MAG TPA: ABC transporter substrate-binding protein [Candidatus Ozemobacteraceae bacterium]|nr:ABC transporter substrate-binding protein [Candidatus Ozemobacteraceae bacterium]